MLINGDRVDAVGNCAPGPYPKSRARADEKMKELIPTNVRCCHSGCRWWQIVARQTVKALRNNVTAKCYGGDVTRKKKLLEKQKAGKKRMKQVGNVEIPQTAFLAVLQVD